ncbi:MAG: TIGR03435 family protein [Candidatus Sulfopaludibacter sp.]|nr:TIGR03435 family protein [Candidatus Sulfopaludibacter sp.]
MIKLLALAAALMAGAAFGQAASPLSFEVASVKPAAPCCAPGQWRESKAGDDRIDFRYVTLRYCLAFAYQVKEYQVSGPSWLGELRYDLVAKGPEGTRREQLPEMMQTLLRERFKVEIHHEKKDFNVFALLLGNNGPKLKPSPEEPAGVEGAHFGMSMSGAGVGRMEVKRGDMTALANSLPRLVGRPVVNLTGLEGRYDFELEFSPEDVHGMLAPPNSADGTPAAPQPGASIFNSIQRIGLKLEAQKRPLDAIAVDRAEKTATGN